MRLVFVCVFLRDDTELYVSFGKKRNLQ